MKLRKKHFVKIVWIITATIVIFSMLAWTGGSWF